MYTKGKNKQMGLQELWNGPHLHYIVSRGHSVLELAPGLKYYVVSPWLSKIGPGSMINLLHQGPISLIWNNSWSITCYFHPSFIKDDLKGKIEAIISLGQGFPIMQPLRQFHVAC